MIGTILGISRQTYALPVLGIDMVVFVVVNTTCRLEVLLLTRALLELSPLSYSPLL